MADFERRKKVVCVWDGWEPIARIYGFSLPVLGETYEIRDTRFVPEYDTLSIALQEIVNRKIETEIGLCEPYFAICRVSGKPNFRPVVKRKTDIGLLEKLLLRKDVRAPERV